MRGKHLFIALSLFSVGACGLAGQGVVQAVVAGPSTLQVGASAQYTVTFVTPGSSPTAPDTPVDHWGATWESSDTAIATVTADGLVTARAPGQVTIRATPFYSVENKIRAGSVNVTVTQ